jgi:hypothetical protein
MPTHDPSVFPLPLSIVHEINEVAKSSQIDRDAAIQGRLSRYFIPYLRHRKVERFLRSPAIPEDTLHTII